MSSQYKKILILHNIRSAQNVGAMFRTADAVGMDQIILSGYSATPVDRFGRPEKKVTKAALGAEQHISWIQSDDIFGTLDGLKKEGYSVASVEQSKKSIDYKNYKTANKQVVIMGNEVEGVDQAILDKSDTILEIPMRGHKESLNVSTACGIVIYRLFDIDIK